MAKTTLICQEEHHNKVWSYEIDGKTVNLEWGRVGGGMQKKSKSYSSPYEAQNELDKVIAEKTRKGYKPITEEGLQKETKTAEQLGQQFKVQNIEFVHMRSQGNYGIQKEFDQDDFALVEILNSWTKESQYLLLSKTENWYFNVKRTIKRDKTIEGSPSRSASNKDPFVVGVRSYLRETFQKVQLAIQKFAAMGTRSLDLGFDEEEGTTDVTNTNFSKVKNEVGSAAASDQVISKFASLGARTLDIF